MSTMVQASIDDSARIQAFLAYIKKSSVRPGQEFSNNDSPEVEDGELPASSNLSTASASQQLKPSDDQTGSLNEVPGPLTDYTSLPGIFEVLVRGPDSSEHTRSTTDTDIHKKPSHEHGSPSDSEAVSGALYQFVQKMNGKSLDESIWSPKQRYRSMPSQAKPDASSIGTMPAKPQVSKPDHGLEHFQSTSEQSQTGLTTGVNASTQTLLTSILASGQQDQTMVKNSISTDGQFMELRERIAPHNRVAATSPASNTPKAIPMYSNSSSIAASIPTSGTHAGPDPVGATSGPGAAPAPTANDTIVQAKAGAVQHSKDETDISTSGPPLPSPKALDSSLPASFRSKWMTKASVSHPASAPTASAEKPAEPVEAPPSKVPSEQATQATTRSPEPSSRERHVDKPAESPKLLSSAPSRHKFDPTAYRGVAPTTDAALVEDRTEQMYFGSWGTQERRDRPEAKIRTVILKSLPLNATPAFVASVVYGGALEEIHMRGTNSASVRFVDGDDCRDFYEETANGLVYGTDGDGREKVIWVHLGKDVDVVGGQLASWISMGYTRCIRATYVDKGLKEDDLVRYASGKNRALEGLESKNSETGVRIVIFYFAKIDDAVQFRGILIRNEDWEHCNISFTTDPCETATGPRLADA